MTMPTNIAYDATLKLSDDFVQKLAALAGCAPRPIAPGQETDAAECLIVGWQTLVDEALLDSYPNLRLIVLRATSQARVDLPSVADRGIELCTLHRYGDEGTAEFVIREILCHFSSPTARAATRREVAGKTLGLFGAGGVARRVAHAARALGMEVIATRQRAEAGWDGDAATVAPAGDLIARSHVVSFHTPPFFRVVEASDLAGAEQLELLVITTLGLPLSPQHLRDWVGHRRRAVLDSVAAHADAEALVDAPGICIRRCYAARTEESVARAEAQMLCHVQAHASREAA